MTIRKRNDAEGYKRGEGAYTRDDDFSRKYSGVDQQFGYPGGHYVAEDRDIKGRKVRNSPGYAAYTRDDDAGLTRTENFEHGAASRQIWSDVESNQDEVDRPNNAIRAGVNRGQTK